MNGCNTFVQYIAIGMKYCKNATVLSRRHCPPRTMFLFSEVVTRRNYFLLSLFNKMF